MLATTIWLLFIAQSFANDLDSHASQQILNKNVDNGTPRDYFDSVHLPNPHYKINYIYEQRRTDEDPEVEQIEEEIGKYMHYQQSTTTTTTEPQQNKDVSENFKEITSHGIFETPIIVPETHHQNHKHKETTSILAPMSLAPELREPINVAYPHFPTAFPATVLVEELKEIQNKDVAGSHLDRPPFPAHERTPTPHRHPNRWLHISPTTSGTPVEVEAQTNHVSTKKHIYLSPTTHIPSFNNRKSHDTLAKVRPILDDIKQGSHGLSPRPVYRGSYKFSWDDINDMHTSSVPKVLQLKENLIPSVPTLSPWYDGYGK